MVVSTGLTSRWGSACLPRPYTPVEAKSPPHERSDEDARHPRWPDPGQTAGWIQYGGTRSGCQSARPAPARYPRRDDGPDVERRRVLEVLLDRALACRADEGVVVFLRESGWNLDVDPDLAHHPRSRIHLYALDEPDALGRHVALLAEAQHVDPGAGRNRRQKNRERRRGRVVAAAARRLVRANRMMADLGIYSAPPGNVTTISIDSSSVSAKTQIPPKRFRRSLKSAGERPIRSNGVLLCLQTPRRVCLCRSTIASNAWPTRLSMKCAVRSRTPCTIFWRT